MNNILIPTMGNQGWLGGVYYVQNIILSSKLVDEKIKFVHWGPIPQNLYENNNLFEETVNYPEIKRGNMAWFKKNLNQRWPSFLPLKPKSPYDLSEQIDVNFSVYDNFLMKKCPFIAWIADFQHLKRPDFFSSDEIKNRNKDFLLAAKTATLVILSSKDASHTFKEHYPEFAHKARVLQFSPFIQKLPDKQKIEEVLNKYQITTPYFFVPNQFWKHKNHIVILEALKVLKKSNKAPLVICSGATTDYRWPDHFKNLQDFINKNQIYDNFRTLGLIPKEDVISLIIAARALINPSMFEGWSTSIEEAKALGKRIILSDIPVHREQAPLGAKYFSPENAIELASLLEAENSDWSRFNSESEALAFNRASSMKFGKAFLDIAREAEEVFFKGPK